MENQDANGGRVREEPQAWSQPAAAALYSKENHLMGKEPWNGSRHEESYLESCRRRVEEQYAHTRLGSEHIKRIARAVTRTRNLRGVIPAR